VKGRLLRGVALPMFIVGPALAGPALVGPAMAANMPLKAPVAPAPALSWTGFYIGADAGYAWGQNATSCTFIPGIGSPCEGLALPTLKSTGGLLGVEVGADWQYKNFVLGAAVDWSALDLHGSTYFPSVDSGKSDQLASRYDWLGTARGRAGYAVGQSLFYGTGGLAFGRVTDTYGNDVIGTSPSNPAKTFTTDFNRTGWAAGAGWEYRLAHNWDLKVEYLHVDLGTTALDISASGTTGNTASGNPPGSSVLHFRHAFDLVRGGVNFRW
jgi:outer membrane immunogenic protein